jgi:hypothetical protein
VTSIVSSEAFKDFLPRDLAYFENNEHFLIPFSSKLHPMGCLKLSLDRITYGEVVEVVRKAREMAMDTPEGMKYQVETLFPRERAKTRPKIYSGPEPGTVRVYSREHVCFYTGKYWKKICL